jgi:uncharacterized oxidoreductase
MSNTSQTFQVQALQAACEGIVRGTGSTQAEAQAVASNLIQANLKGHDSHGVGMLPRYVDAVLEGGLQPNAEVAVRLDAGSLLSLDGQRGYGQVIGAQTMTMAIARAQRDGVCIAALGNSHHLGRIGHWAEMAVDAGLVAMHFVNVLSRPVVAPWGGADGRFGTNPCCIGIPLKGREPFLLDFATSRVAQGKMRVAHNEQRRVPEGYLIDPHGAPTTDPGVVVVSQPPGPWGNVMGALMPFGEHKGFGLAMACELLGGALTAGGTWHSKDYSRRSVYNGMLTVLIDPDKLGTRQTFEQEAEAFMGWMDEAPAAPGGQAVQTAGEPERAKRADRLQAGIAIDAQTVAELASAAQKVGVSDWLAQLQQNTAGH